MKTNRIFFTTLMLAAPLALWLQGSALAQAAGGTNTGRLSGSSQHSVPTKFLVGKVQIQLIQALVKNSPVTTRDSAEFFELAPGSSSERRLRSDVVPIPILPAEKSALDFVPLGQVFYMSAENKFYIQWDGVGASTLHYYGPFPGDPEAFACLSGFGQTLSPFTEPVAEQSVKSSASSNSVAPAFQDNVEFFFPGGTPREFLAAVDKQCKVDWEKVADIPENMRFVHIPALRMNRQSAEQILGQPALASVSPAFSGGSEKDVAARNPLKGLIVLYNSLPKAKREVGILMVEGDLAKPSVVLFQSLINKPSIERQIKVFALRGIPENEWEKLQQEINKQFDMEFERRERETLATGSAPVETGSVSIHKDTGVLVVAGPAWCVEAAESWVAAFHANHPPQTPPNDHSGLLNPTNYRVGTGYPSDPASESTSPVRRNGRE